MAQDRHLVKENDRGRVSIYRRPESGQVFYYDLQIDGQRVRRSTGTEDQAEAEGVAAREFADGLSRANAGAAVGQMNAGHYIREFIKWREQQVTEGLISEATVYNDRMYLRGWLQPWMEARKLARLEDIDFAAWLEWRKSAQSERDREHSYRREGRLVRGRRAATHFKPPALTTLQKERNSFMQFLKFCQRRGWTTEIPEFPELRKPKVQTVKRTRGIKAAAPVVVEYSNAKGHDWLTLEEYRALVRVASANLKREVQELDDCLKKYPHIYKKRIEKAENPLGYLPGVVTAQTFLWWLRIMVHSGMRPVEWRGLTWRQVLPTKFRDGSRGVELFVHGKGKVRQVVLSKTVAPYIYAMCKFTTGKGFENIRGTEFEDYYVFPVQDYRKILQRLAAEAGIRKHMTQYAFRHTFINWQLLYTDTTIEDLSTISGNSPAVIREHYNQITPFLMQERRQRITGLFNAEG